MKVFHKSGKNGNETLFSIVPEEYVKDGKITMAAIYVFRLSDNPPHVYPGDSFLIKA